MPLKGAQFPLCLAESILVEWYALQTNIDSAIDLFDRRVLGVAQNRCAASNIILERHSHAAWIDHQIAMMLTNHLEMRMSASQHRRGNSSQHLVQRFR